VAAEGASGRSSAAVLAYGGLATLALGALVAALFAPGVVVGPLAALAAGAYLALLGRAGYSSGRDDDEERMSIGQILERQVQNGRRISIIDPSTGLLQKWYFDLRVSEEISRSSRYGLAMTVVRLSVGSEKPVQEGAEEWHLARAIVRQLRQVDIASRMSGTDFVVCLPHTGNSGGRIVAARLVRSLREWQVKAGVASFPEHGKDVEALEGAALACQSDDWPEAGPGQPHRHAGLQQMVARLRPGEVASLPLAATDSAKLLRQRLRRASKQAGKDIMIWQGPGQMFFRLMGTEAESEVA
jgi:GGDEF domain-containing protein